MGRHGPSGDDRRDALRVSVTFLWIIVDSMIGLASACLLIGIVVAGVMMLADRASDNDEKMWHSGLAAKHLKAHPGQCNCAARYAAIADLKRKLTKQN